MEYNKLTKAQLIELIENTISIEKYNKLEENLKVKKKALEEQEVVIESLKQQVDLERTTAKNQLKEFEEKANQYITQIQSSTKDMKGHIEYTSNMLTKEYQLANLLVENRSKDNKLIDELIKLYHEAVFENKEEEKNTGE
jgi:hypothetical protein